jgi:hypothetical protein
VTRISLREFRKYEYSQSFVKRSKSLTYFAEWKDILGGLTELVKGMRPACSELDSPGQVYTVVKCYLMLAVSAISLNWWLIET